MATTSAAAAATGADLASFKLGVASYSLREFSRKHAISILKQLGVTNVNIKEFHLPYRASKEDLLRGRAEFDKAGLTVLGGGTIGLAKEDEADIRFHFEYAKMCGMPLMVVAPTARTMPMIEKFVREYDIKVAVHNHGPEDKHFPTPQSALKVVKDMDPRCGLCIDIGHTARTGVDIVEAIAEAGPRLLDMHVKDLKNLKERSSQVPVGDGELPIIGILKQLKKMNYTGGVMLEYEIDDFAPLPGMHRSLAYLRGALAGLKG